jgi:hypothetical protein
MKTAQETSQRLRCKKRAPINRCPAVGKALRPSSGREASRLYSASNNWQFLFLTWPKLVNKKYLY